MPKDMRGGSASSNAKETNQVPSPQASQASPKVNMNQQLPNGGLTVESSSGASSCNSCNDSSSSSHNPSRFSLASSSHPQQQQHQHQQQASSPCASSSYPMSGPGGAGGSNADMTDRSPRNTNTNCLPSTLTSSQVPPAPKLEYCEQKLSCANKYAFGDHLLQVLTPSEIMKSLPDLKQDDCSGACPPSAMVRVWGMVSSISFENLYECKQPHVVAVVVILNRFSASNSGSIQYCSKLLYYAAYCTATYIKLFKLSCHESSNARVVLQETTQRSVLWRLTWNITHAIIFSRMTARNFLRIADWKN
jgi:hypothetical protein